MVKRKVELGLYKDEADSVSLDIQQFVEGEVERFLSEAPCILGLFQQLFIFTILKEHR